MAGALDRKFVVSCWLSGVAEAFGVAGSLTHHVCRALALGHAGVSGSATNGYPRRCRSAQRPKEQRARQRAGAPCEPNNRFVRERKRKFLLRMRMRKNKLLYIENKNAEPEPANNPKP
eukprot:scaffold19984_cov127-Isochrysis_galbana.AAC.9